MLRTPAVIATTALVMALSGPALAQAVDLLQPIVAFLSTQSDTPLMATTEAAPTGGAETSEDTGDFEHMTGEGPRFTPNYVDIQRGAFFDLRPGPVELFGPTNTASIWAPTGPRELEPDGGSRFHTYTGNIPQDGSQYQDGALLFEIDFREAPPPEPGGRCDFVVWINDASRGNQFENLPAFPLDPAAGHNLAFGLQLNPTGGGIPTTFALATDESGVFHPIETDVRAVLLDDSIGIFVPRAALAELASVNYYAVCWTGDSAVDPETSGADQTGSIAAGLEEAGVIAIEEAPVVATPTTTVEVTTSIPAANSSIPAGSTDGGGVPSWAPAAAAVAILGTVGYWAVARRRNPEERALAAWRRAERDLAKAETEAEPILVASLEAGAVLEELEHERVDLCRVWPPVCLADEETDDPDGLSTHDRHFRRMALGELWADYQEGKIGVDQVEARWRQVNTPEFRDRMRESNDAYQETLAQLDDEIADARAVAEPAYARGSTAGERVASAREAVVGARLAYLDAMEGAPTDPLPAASHLTDKCEHEGSREAIQDGPTERIRVNVGFMLTVGRFAGRERSLERGERLVFEMEGVLKELELGHSIDEARRAGLHVSWSGHEYEPGVYWLTGGGIIRDESGEAPAPQTGSETERAVSGSTPSLSHFPTSIADHATSRVTGWTTGFETLTMQRTFFHQLVTSRRYSIWECHGGRWVHRDRAWRIEVGEPLRNRGEVRWFSAGSPARRAQFETELNRVAWVATGVVTRDLRRLFRWRAERVSEPGR